jgi:hypothetical protein
MAIMKTKRPHQEQSSATNSDHSVSDAALAKMAELSTYVNTLIAKYQNEKGLKLSMPRLCERYQEQATLARRWAELLDEAVVLLQISPTDKVPNGEPDAN